MAPLPLDLRQNHETDPVAARCPTNLALAGVVAGSCNAPDLNGLSHTSRHTIEEFKRPHAVGATCPLNMARNDLTDRYQTTAELDA
jgi:hypothetical protein